MTTSSLGRRRFLISPETPLVFLHVEKCAGTSVHPYLSDVFPKESIFPGRHIEDFDQIVPGYSVYSGHMKLWQWNSVGLRPHFVIWLRRPVPRVISAYYYWASILPEEIALNPRSEWVRSVHEMSPLEFVESSVERIHRSVCDGVCRALSPDQSLEGSPPKALQALARSSLRRFAYIGLAEKTNYCLRRLAARFHLPSPSTCYWRNSYEENAKLRGRNMAAERPITSAIIDAIKANNTADVALYNIARLRSALMW